MKRAWIVFAILCILQTAACEEDKARMRFFLDLSSKAPQPGYEIQFIFVIWNEGRVAAENVRLPVPLLQLEPYEHLSHLTYVRESMSINREYHPNTSEESYFFVPRQPLTDIQDGDEGTYDESSNTVTFSMGRMEPNDYAVWAFRATVDADAPCEEAPYVQNWVTISADNASDYENDIIGHIVCESPRLTALKEADRTDPGPGDEIVYTIAYSLDETVVAGIDPARFDVRRVRIYDSFPSEYLEIVSIGNGGEEQGGAIFWQIDRLENGGSGTVSWTARVKDGVPPGTAITNTVEILSQNTVEDQDVGSSCTVTVPSP
jgi:hypothetical protein